MSPLLRFALDAMAELFDRPQIAQEEDRLDDQTRKLYLLVKHRLAPPPTRH